MKRGSYCYKEFSHVALSLYVAASPERQHRPLEDLKPTYEIEEMIWKKDKRPKLKMELLEGSEEKLR